MRILTLFATTALALLSALTTPTHASPKGFVDLIELVAKSRSVVDDSVRLSDDIVRKVREGKELTPEELEQFRSFASLLEHGRLKDADIVLLDSRGRPLRNQKDRLSSDIEQYVVEDVKQHLAPYVDQLVRDLLVGGKTEVDLDALARDVARRLDTGPERTNVSYTFNVTSGEFSVTLKRGNRELQGSVNLYDKLLTVGIAVVGYQTVTTPPANGEASSGGDSSSPAILFLLLLSAVVCCLWAQYSDRSGVLWFFLGFVFSVIAWALILLLTHRDLKSGRTRRWVV